MQATVAVTKWVTQTLLDNGYDSSRIKIQLNELLPVAMASEGRKSHEYWTGLYHVIAFDGLVCLYTYSQLEKRGMFYKSNIASSDMDPIDLPEGFSEEVSSDESKPAAESKPDHKFQNELNAAQEFINKSEKEKAKKNNPNFQSNQPTLPHDDTMDTAVSTKDQAKEFQNETNLVVGNLMELFEVLDSHIAADHWANRVYRGLNNIDHTCIKVINKEVVFSNPELSINAPLMGSVLIQYKDSKSDKTPVMSLGTLSGDGVYIETPYFLGEENNFTVIGKPLTKDDKWYFVANDFNSGLSLYRATGVTTIVAAKGVDIGFVFNELLLNAANAKIRFFRNESINMRDSHLNSIKFDADYGIGHIFIDCNVPTWGDYSNQFFLEHGADADVKFKALINDAIQEGKKYLESLS